MIYFSFFWISATEPTLLKFHYQTIQNIIDIEEISSKYENAIEIFGTGRVFLDETDQLCSTFPIQLSVAPFQFDAAQPWPRFMK